jgi:transcription initiation factor IIE alpha subunit
VKAMRKISERIRKRLDQILTVLPTNAEKGKTYEEIAEETEYSVATIRGDLGILRGQNIVGCDDERRPFKWYKTIKEK